MSLWDRLPEETNPAWVAFQTYLDLGLERSLDKAFRKLKNREETAIAPGRWNVWSRTHRWVERARAWDDHLAQKEREAKERAIAELGRRRAERELVVQDRLEELSDFLFEQVKKHKAAPVTDVHQVEVSGQGDNRVEKVTKVKAMKTSGLARLSEETRDAMRQSVVGLRDSEDGKPPVSEPKKPIPDWLAEALKKAQNPDDHANATNERALAGRP